MVAKQIFVSVGTRFTMDRLLEGVDNVLSKRNGLEAVAQIGDSDFQSPNIRVSKWMSAVEFEKEILSCDIFISHAGMGNILLAAKCKKPIIIMPRRTDLKEHINNHQFATAEAMKKKSFISIANTALELDQKISNILTPSNYDTNDIDANNRNQLIHTIKSFINNGEL